MDTLDILSHGDIFQLTYEEIKKISRIIQDLLVRKGSPSKTQLLNQLSPPHQSFLNQNWEPCLKI